MSNIRWPQNYHTIRMFYWNVLQTQEYWRDEEGVENLFHFLGDIFIISQKHGPKETVNIIIIHWENVQLQAVVWWVRNWTVVGGGEWVNEMQRRRADLSSAYLCVSMRWYSINIISSESELLFFSFGHLMWSIGGIGTTFYYCYFTPSLFPLKHMCWTRWPQEYENEREIPST